MRKPGAMWKMKITTQQIASSNSKKQLLKSPESKRSGTRLLDSINLQLQDKDSQDLNQNVNLPSKDGNKQSLIFHQLPSQFKSPQLVFQPWKPWNFLLLMVE